MADEDFLRLLFRDERLSGSEFAGRLRVVNALAAHKLRSVLPSVPRLSVQRLR